MDIPKEVSKDVTGVEAEKVTPTVVTKPETAPTAKPEEVKTGETIGEPEKAEEISSEIASTPVKPSQELEEKPLETSQTEGTGKAASGGGIEEAIKDNSDPYEIESMI